MLGLNLTLSSGRTPPFNPSLLFRAGEQGVWYDPSDLSTLFQDAAGTTPVTAVEQPVGLMLDKSGNGNHAFQTTATSRPVLSARVNLLTRTEQFDDAAWTKEHVTITANAVVAPDGTLTADKLFETASTGVHRFSRATPISAATTYTASVYVKAAERRYFGMKTGIAAAPPVFDLLAGTVVTGKGAIVDVGDGWYRCSCTFSSGESTSHFAYWTILINPTFSGETYTGDGTSGIYVWGADLRVANDGANLPPYQRVNTATDYDTVGFPHYLRFDGVDDWLVTPTITPGIDKVQVFAGVRKLSDASTAGMLAELSVTSAANNGVFALFAPNEPGTYALRSRGTTGADSASAASYASPITNVIAGIGDISGDRSTLRINGVQAAQSTANQGTGNFLTYPLYIGRRGGTVAPFNGHLYGLIVRFGANLPIEAIEKTEKYINQKTRAY